MTGHQPIIGMRLAGKSPRSGMIWAKTDGTENRRWHEFGDHAEVGIGKADYPELLDLRFAMGLTVVVEGTDPDRVAGVGKAFKKAQAGRVIEHVDTAGQWPEPVSIADTKGVLTWRK